MSLSSVSTDLDETQMHQSHASQAARDMLDKEGSVGGRNRWQYLSELSNQKKQGFKPVDEGKASGRT